MKNITIKIIDHKEQRYPTVGDWYWNGDDLEIRISKLSDWRHEMLVTVHELCEVIMCEQEGITQQSVDDFDMEYEKKRAPGDESEPGDQTAAPYHRPHVRASNLERTLADHLGVELDDYEADINSLP